MDRLTFLRSLLGSTALLTVPPLELITPEEQDRLAWTKDATPLFMYDCFVRGFSHYAGAQVIGQMKDHDELDLVREHANEHDANAVSIYWQGHKLGYLPMGENIALANLIDHGMLLSAYVLYTAPELTPWEQCFVGVELLVPGNPSFDAYLDHYMDRPDAGFKLHQHYGGPADPDAAQG
jgi:hypothetical protein